MVLAHDANAPFVASWAERSEKTCCGKMVSTLGEAVPGLAPTARMQLGDRTVTQARPATMRWPMHGRSWRATAPGTNSCNPSEGFNESQ